MSRITCLIIFSGSSARSTMSFRFARIKVLTRSKSPMMHLLSKSKYCKPLKTLKKNRRLPVAFKISLGQQVQAPNPHRKFHQPRQRNQAERNHLLKRVDRPAQEVVKQESDRHHHENPSNEKFFFPGHCHPPKPSGVPVGPPRPTGAEAIVMTCWQPAAPALAPCRQSGELY